MTHQLTFDAVAEETPGPKWRARWKRSWPAYRAWFERRGGLGGPDRSACEAALARHMPELVPVHARLTELAGGGDMAARFLSTWCPPAYLGGCSIAALSLDGETRIIRNYDLSPDLNEGLLLRSAWTGRPVMGMVEFLWGLSDGINADGLAVTLAFGGTRKRKEGFGICTILRYVLETCSDVPEALAVLDRVPSHMDYNIVLADASGRTASVEVHAGGGTTPRTPAIATNHQLDVPLPDRASFTRTVERRAELETILTGVEGMGDALRHFLKPPLRQTDYANGFGTLFTAETDPQRRSIRLVWPEEEMAQDLGAFEERTTTIRYGEDTPRPAPSLSDVIAAVPASRRKDVERWLEQAEAGEPDWIVFGALFWDPGRSRAKARTGSGT
jgi:predicted choloylglycine hydrolase